VHGRNVPAAEVLIFIPRDKMRVDHQRRENSIKTRESGFKTPSIIAAAACFFVLAISSSTNAIEIEMPAVGLAGVPMDYAITGAAPGETVKVSLGERNFSVDADEGGRAKFVDIVIEETGNTGLTATAGNEVAEASVRVIPAWISILPAVVAIAVALTLRNVIPALLLGLWLGATALQSFTLKGAGLGLLDSFQVFVRGALADSDRPCFYCSLYDDDRRHGRNHHPQWRDGQYCPGDSQSGEDCHWRASRRLAHGTDDFLRRLQQYAGRWKYSPFSDRPFENIT